MKEQPVFFTDFFDIRIEHIPGIPDIDFQFIRRQRNTGKAETPISVLLFYFKLVFIRIQDHHIQLYILPAGEKSNHLPYISADPIDGCTASFIEQIQMFHNNVFFKI